MRTESDINLVRVLGAYERSQAYFLVPAILQGNGSPEFLFELSILKQRLSVKTVSEVAEHDLEAMAPVREQHRDCFGDLQGGAEQANT